MVASLKPVATPAAEAEEDVNPAAAAGALLEQGMGYFREGNYPLAAKAFRYSVDTGSLNNAGRALAYWHIFASAKEQGHTNDAADALSSFVVVAQDILDVRNRYRYAVSASGDFVDRFGLDEKLQHARAMLSATWASRTGYFGRSANQPVPVHTDEERERFLEIVAPCDDTERDERSHRTLANTHGAPVQRVTLSCGDGQAPVEYYFEMVEDGEGP